MNVSRVLPLALGWLSLAAGLSAQAGEEVKWPAILAPPVVRAPAFEPAGLASPLSERMREVLRQRVQGDAPAFVRPASSFTASTVAPLPLDTDVLALERFVVNAPPPRKVALAPNESRLTHFLKTGTLWSNAAGTAELYLRFLPIAPLSATSPRDFTRIEFGFKLKW
jgi:hypothetical protein